MRIIIFILDFFNGFFYNKFLIFSFLLFLLFSCSHSLEMKLPQELIFFLVVIGWFIIVHNNLIYNIVVCHTLITS